MELQIRPMCYEERKYAYEQSSQLMSQTGSIGRLRGDFGSGGMEFWMMSSTPCTLMSTAC